MNHPTWMHLQVENERLRAENARYRQSLELTDGRHINRVRRAYVAALAMAKLHVGYLDTSRETVQAAGLTQRQWENGRALLSMARVLDGRRWMCHDLPSIEARLQAARERAIQTPESFRAWLPRHALR